MRLLIEFDSPLLFLKNRFWVGLCYKLLNPMSLEMSCFWFLFYFVSFRLFCLFCLFCLFLCLVLFCLLALYLDPMRRLIGV